MTDTTSAAPSLLPCPFCGHDTPEFERLGTSGQSCIVACGNCGARHESSDEYEDSGSSWNHRASQPVAREPLTDEQKRRLNPYKHSRSAASIWIGGFEAAERAHGITNPPRLPSVVRGCDDPWKPKATLNKPS